MKEKAASLFKESQESICKALENCDGSGEKFSTDMWERTDQSTSYGGWGETKVFSKGNVFEHGAVNFSKVEGTMPARLAKNVINKDKDVEFFATGTSLIIHPFSPLVPTVHANFRFLQVDGQKWFGGGADLTPFYVFDEDAVFFHTQWKNTCDKYGRDYYNSFKKQCDQYFYLAHRQEARGIGGIFYDYLGQGKTDKEFEDLFPFITELCSTFIKAYIPIVDKRKNLEFTNNQKKFQLLRRGRYVEFNLIYDKGTKFGLETNGRTESILASLPPEVNWQYCYTPEDGSEEARLIEILKNPRDWV